MYVCGQSGGLKSLQYIMSDAVAESSSTPSREASISKWLNSHNQSCMTYRKHVNHKISMNNSNRMGNGDARDASLLQDWPWLPIDDAIMGGYHSDRLAYAFAAGYLASLRYILQWNHTPHCDLSMVSCFVFVLSYATQSGMGYGGKENQ
jgi:hypothetical protein